MKEIRYFSCWAPAFSAITSLDLCTINGEEHLHRLLFTLLSASHLNNFIKWAISLLNTTVKVELCCTTTMESAEEKSHSPP